jgi:NADPH-dependent glutamate synthase beta subunit-like oxidoreductase
VSLGTLEKIGDRVVVLGGGNVAFDCARTAIRLGAKEVVIACLETREAMTASEDEILEGLKEGLKLLNARTFLNIEGLNNKGTGVRCQEVSSFTFDEEGKLQLIIKPDSEHVIEADTIIFAAGQRPEIPQEWDIPVKRGNLIETENEIKVIGRNDLFAAGDAVYGTNSVIQAIAAGRKAASVIGQELNGDGDIEDKLTNDETPSQYLGKEEDFLKANRNQCMEGCYDDSLACGEAGRCLQCDLRTTITRPKLWIHYKIK